MRKGIVMEQKKAYTIVMTSDGSFHRTKRLNHVEVGMEVDFQIASEARNKWVWTQLLQHSRTKVAVIAAVLLLALFPLNVWNNSSQAYAYVNIDMNPSVELELNDDMQVLAIDPQNEEAEKLVSMLHDWNRKSASEVTFNLIQLSQEHGFVSSENQNQVLIGISYIQKDSKGNFSNQIESFLSKQSLSVSIAAYDVPGEVREQALNEQSSVNELLAKKIESEPKDQTSEVTPVEIEDDDKALIKSFYKSDQSETNDGLKLKKDSKNPNSQRPFHPSQEKNEKVPGQQKKGNSPFQGQLKDKSKHGNKSSDKGDKKKPEKKNGEAKSKKHKNKEDHGQKSMKDNDKKKHNNQNRNKSSHGKKN